MIIMNIQLYFYSGASVLYSSYYGDIPFIAYTSCKMERIHAHMIQAMSLAIRYMYTP